MDSLIAELNAAGVRYLVIGGQAVRLHGLPRFSMDWDLFIPPWDTANFNSLKNVLGDELDIDLLPLGEKGENIIQTYQTRFGIIQFHLAVPGITSFTEAERRAVELKDEDGRLARCLSADDLLASKESANRPQDQQDIAFLKALLSSREND
ncbi:MAG: hypothetical protein KJ626_11620 [Verrucomicrobia bacterium]|nr:hypothetical protein [Verrucomicrobiota bacterium]